MIESSCHRYPFCEADLDPAWVAQWDGKLTREQDRWIQQTVEIVERVGALYPQAASNA